MLCLVPPGVGPSKATEWYNAGIRTLADAHNAGRFGISVTEGMKLGLKYYDDLKERIPRAEVAQLYKGIQGAGALACAESVLDSRLTLFLIRCRHSLRHRPSPARRMHGLVPPRPGRLR